MKPTGTRKKPVKTKREWHGCKDSRGHSFVEGVCQTEGCGMDIRVEGDLLGVELPEPTSKELLAKERAKDQQCLFCPPNRGENASRKPKHESKPKRKDKR